MSSLWGSATILAVMSAFVLAGVPCSLLYEIIATMAPKAVLSSLMDNHLLPGSKPAVAHTAEFWKMGFVNVNCKLFCFNLLSAEVAGNHFLCLVRWGGAGGAS